MRDGSKNLRARLPRPFIVYTSKAQYTRPVRVLYVCMDRSSVYVTVGHDEGHCNVGGFGKETGKRSPTDIHTRCTLADSHSHGDVCVEPLLVALQLLSDARGLQSDGIAD
jgi:hypothetical protein